MVSSDFVFMGKHLKEFNFIMAKPNDEDTSGLTRNILKGATTMNRSQSIHYGTVYDNTIIIPMFIIRYDCIDDTSIITPYELRKIQTWLTRPKLPQPLYIMTKEGNMPIEYHGVFTDIQPYSYNGLNGLILTFTCDSPFAYDQRKIKIKSSNARNGVDKLIYCDTDENEFIYPCIYFYPNVAGQIEIVNNDENKTMKLTFSTKYNEVIIDCGIKTIVADGNVLSLSDVNFETVEITDFNNVNTGLYKMYWLRLKPFDNNVTIKGNGDFTIIYKNLWKLGGLIDV